MSKNSQKSEARSQKFKKFKSFVFYFSLFTFHFSLVSLVVASGGEGGKQPSLFMDYFWKIINFGILFFILFKFGKKPLGDFLKNRTELIEKTLKEAQEAKALAQKALAEVEERLKVKDKEIEDIVSSARQSGEREKAHLIAEGEKMKAKILEQAKTNIDFEVKRAKEDIKAEAVEVAMELAEKKLIGRLTKEDQIKLLEESLAKIEGKN